MKKLTLLSLAALAVFGSLFTFQSCDKVKNLHYDLPLQTGSVEITIPPTTDTSSEHAVGTGSAYYNIDSFIKANTGNALGINNITSVKLTSVKLTLLDGTTTNNFANFQSAYASFYTSANSTPYRSSITNNPDVEAYELNPPVDANYDLKSYITNGGNTFYYSVGGKLRRAVTQSVRCKVEYKFNITVNN